MVDLTRRAFLNTTGAGIGAVGLAACGGGGSSPSGGGNSGGTGPVGGGVSDGGTGNPDGGDPDPGGGDPDPVDPPVNADPGTYSYDAGTRMLALNLGALPDCGITAGTVMIKLRALYNDSMYWRVTAMEMVDGAMENRLFIQQWIRTSASTGTPTIAGTYVNNLGYELTLGASGAANLKFTGPGCESYGYLGDVTLPVSPFRHGVASGDPSAAGFIAWTRAVGDSDGDVELTLEVATSTDFASDTVVSMSVMADANQDNTVKETLATLSPATEYYYRFTTTSLVDSEGQPHVSTIGRAKTLPTGSTDSLRFGVASCSSYPHGFFNAYRLLARRDDLDVIFHLGDYTYEYPGVAETPSGDQNPDDYADDAALAQGRFYRHGNRTETIKLEDYRLRFRNYREDADLLLLHTRYAFINTWDDHETSNDSFDPDLDGTGGGAENHNDHGRDEGIWEVRKSAAARAYNEWLPITDVRSTGALSYNDPRLNRAFTFGDLAELVILDTRVQGRTLQPDQTVADYNDATRRMMSAEQDTWMRNKLTAAQAGSDGQPARTWKFLGQQTMVGHLVGPPLQAAMEAGEEPENLPVNTTSSQFNSVTIFDQWDGYNAHRNEILDFIKGENDIDNNDIENFVVLTGDIHTSWAINIEDDPRERGVDALGNGVFSNGATTATPPTLPPSQRYGVEFVTPSITSPGLPDFNRALSESLNRINPHMEYIDLSMHGYTVVDVTPEKATCDWYHVEDILDVENENETLAATHAATAGTPTLDGSMDLV